ncbi:MAG: hypothetical protein HYS09_07820 [Chloroflexi bacterium]|nr:hypothetical protein [Chloroflexota bacterium]
MSGPPTLIVFLGGMGGSAVEENVARARAAAALDTIERALATGAYAGAVITTDSPEAVGPPPDAVTIDADEGPFRFLDRLTEVVRRYRPESFVYLGGGSLPLLSADELVGLARALAGEEEVAVTNNAYSSDLVAVRPADAVERLRNVDSDNALARALAEDVGLTVHSLPRTVSTQFDIDSPADLAVLKLTGHPQAGPRLRACLEGLDLDLEPHRRVADVLTDPEGQVLVSGRVGSHVGRPPRPLPLGPRLLRADRGAVPARLHPGRPRRRRSRPARRPLPRLGRAHGPHRVRLAGARPQAVGGILTAENV